MPDLILIMLGVALGFAARVAVRLWGHLPAEWVDRWRMHRLWRRNRRNSRRASPAPRHVNCRCAKVEIRADQFRIYSPPLPELDLTPYPCHRRGAPESSRFVAAKFNDWRERQ